MRSIRLGDFKLTAPYVKKLTEQIDSCADLTDRAILTAELGCYWARVGEFDEAERLRVALRAGFGDGRDIRVSILIMCVEGLLLYFRELSPDAQDRLARAKLLSDASGDKQLIALTSAWLAHIHFNNNNYEAMAKAISACLVALKNTNLSALCRVAMLLGDAHLYSGNPLIAQAWYEKARDSALLLGDQAFVGALIYNRSALRVFLARVAAADVEQAEDYVRLLSGEVKSAINYQCVARLRSLDHLLATSKIGVLMLQARFMAARGEIQTLLNSPDVKPLSSQALILRTDLALCYAKTDQFILATDVIDEVCSVGFEKCDVGDQVLIYGSLKEAYRCCGLTQFAEHIEQKLVDALVNHRRNSVALSELIAPFASVAILARFQPGAP